MIRVGFSYMPLEAIGTPVSWTPSCVKTGGIVTSVLNISIISPKYMGLYNTVRVNFDFQKVAYILTKPKCYHYSEYCSRQD